MVENILVTIWITPTSPFSVSEAELPPVSPPIMEERSRPVLWICRGYSARVSVSMDLI